MIRRMQSQEISQVSCVVCRASAIKDILVVENVGRKMLSIAIDLGDMFRRRSLELLLELRATMCVRLPSGRVETWCNLAYLDARDALHCGQQGCIVARIRNGAHKLQPLGKFLLGTLPLFLLNGLNPLVQVLFFEGVEVGVERIIICCASVGYVPIIEDCPDLPTIFIITVCL